MNQLWTTLTFDQTPLSEWYRRSFLCRTIGTLAPWQSGSWLLQWSDGIGAILVSLVLALAPFVSTGLTGLLLFACAAFWVLLTLTTPVGAGVTPMQLLVTVYWSIATIATVFSPVRSAAFTGLLKLSLYLIFFALVVRVLRSIPWRNFILSAYLLTAMVVSAYGIRQAFLGATSLATWVDPTSPLVGTTRVYSYLGNPNLLAGYLIPAVCLSLAAIFAWQGWGCKALAVGMSVLNLSCLVLTYSRGGWIGCFFALLVLSLLLIYWMSQHWGSFWQTWAIPIVLGTLAIVLILAFLTVEPLQVRVMSIFAGREDSSNNFRMNVWAAVLEMIHDRPWLGIGPGNNAFNHVYPLYQRPRFTALSAYSVVLEIVVETGAIGFTCFLWLLLTTATQGLRYITQARSTLHLHFQSTDPKQVYWLMAGLATIAGMLGHGLVDTVWYRPQVSTLWWLMLGLIASYGSSYGSTSLPGVPSSNMPPNRLDS